MTTDPSSKATSATQYRELLLTCYSAALVTLPAGLAVGSLQRVIIDDVVQRDLVRKLNRLFASRGVTHETLAQGAILIAESPMMFPPRGTMFNPQTRTVWAHSVALRAAAATISWIGMRHQLLPKPVSSEELAGFFDGPDAPANVHAIATALRELPQEAGVRVRGVILTPLGKISDHEQESVLAVGEAISRMLDDEYGIRALIPGLYMKPSDLAQGDGIEMFHDARGKVDGVDVVIAILGDHESEGMSKCITWAESLGIPVLVLRGKVAGMSKVVSRSDAFTSQQLYEADAAGNTETTRTFIDDHFDLIRAHARDRINYALRVQPQLPILRELVRGSDPQLVTGDRLSYVMSSPEGVASMTAAEARHICDALTVERAGRFLAIVYGREASVTPEVDDAVLASLETFLTANPSVSTTEGLKMMRTYMQERESLTATAADRLPDGAGWAKLLERVRA